MSVASDDSRSEAERHFSLDMLQARVDEHASNLEESTRRRMQSLRELIDSREQELMEEIRDNAREQSQLLVQAKADRQRPVEISLDASRFLGNIDACFDRISRLQLASEEPCEEASELPRDLGALVRGTPGGGALGTPARASRTPLQERQGNEHGSEEAMAVGGKSKPRLFCISRVSTRAFQTTMLSCVQGGKASWRSRRQRI